MKRSIVGIMAAAMALAASLVWYSCTKDSDEDITGTIYGTVTDYATGEPIGNANVKLRPSGETTLTGMDGTFQFNNLGEGKYSLLLSKNGYVDLDDDYVINLSRGGNIRRDIQMRSQKTSFKLTINGNEFDNLDFGANPSVQVIMFTIENDGTMNLGTIRLQSSTDWAYFDEDDYYTYTGKEIYNLAPNEGVSCALYVYRQNLLIGENTGYVSVSSGTLTKTFVIKGTGLGMPAVSEVTLTNVTSSTCVAHSSVLDNGGWNIVDKGFQYVLWINHDYHTGYVSCGPGENDFQSQISWDVNQSENKVRAYASNGVYIAYSGWKYINN